jgi:curved DNA-binding protein CbpA
LTEPRDAYQVLEVSRHASTLVVRAAYWRLARQFHPDGTTPDVVRMTEVNAAYEAIERERQPTGRAAPDPVAAGPSPSASATHAGGPPQGSLLHRMREAEHGESPMLDFGQYTGWRIAEIAKQDPRYLRWLSRQVSGVRYRGEIDRVLGRDRETGNRASPTG